MNGDRWEAPDTVKIDGCMRFACIFIGSVCTGIVLAYLVYFLWR